MFFDTEECCGLMSRELDRLLQRHGKSAFPVPIVLNEFHPKIGYSERTEELLTPLAALTLVTENSTVVPLTSACSTCQREKV